MIFLLYWNYLFVYMVVIPPIHSDVSLKPPLKCLELIKKKASLCRLDPSLAIGSGPSFGKLVLALKIESIWWASSSILVTFWGTTEHFSRKNGGLTWSILVEKQKHDVQRPKRWPLFSVFAPGLTSHSINHDAPSNLCVGYRLKLIWTVLPSITDPCAALCTPWRQFEALITAPLLNRRAEGSERKKGS